MEQSIKQNVLITRIEGRYVTYCIVNKLNKQLLNLCFGCTLLQTLPMLSSNFKVVCLFLI